jgi:hypothetical protein
MKLFIVLIRRRLLDKKTGSRNFSRTQMRIESINEYTKYRYATLSNKFYRFVNGSASEIFTTAT